MPVTSTPSSFRRTLTLTLLERLCRNDKKAAFVILNKVKNPRSVLGAAKNLSSFTTFRTSLRLRPQNDTPTRSPGSGKGAGQERFEKVNGDVAGLRTSIFVFAGSHLR